MTQPDLILTVVMLAIAITFSALGLKEKIFYLFSGFAWILCSFIIMFPLHYALGILTLGIGMYLVIATAMEA